MDPNNNLKETTALIKSGKILEEDYRPLSSFEMFNNSIEIKEAPRDYWLLLLSKFGNFTGFSLLSLGATIFLIEVQKFSDIETGLIIIMLGLCGASYSLIFGFIPDHYGIKLSLGVCNLIGCLGFATLVVIENRYIQLIAILTMIMVSVAISVPATKLAVKRYTNERSRSMGYSLYYLIYYGSAAVAGLSIDLLLSAGNEDHATFKIIFGISACLLFVSAVVSFCLRELNVHTRGEEEVRVRGYSGSPWEHTKAILVLKSFWRFLILTLFLVLSRSIYYHLEITLPIYMYREIGDGAHFGYMIVLHELVMIIGTPTLTVLVYYMSNYSLLILGAFISGVSPLILLFGSDYVHVIIFVVVLSIGESIHAPRFIEYTLMIAPVGKEGIFLAVAASPLPLGLIISGLSAGFLLDGFCPEEGDRNCWAMWLIIGGISLITPIVMLWFRSALEQPLFEPQPFVSWSKEAKLER